MKSRNCFPKASVGKESFEKVPFITSALTHFGYYVLIILGFINRLLFTPNVATEKRRKVCKIIDF